MGFFSKLFRGPIMPRAELSFRGLNDTALEHRLRNAIAGHRWTCDHCSTVEFIERESGCWACGKGQMIYRSVPPLVEVLHAYDELNAIRARSGLHWNNLSEFQQATLHIADKAMKSLSRLLPRS